jgi:tetratricopeptide (TPR) repeat protein
VNELRLLFSRAGNDLTCQIATSWGEHADAPQPFTPFLSGDDHEALRWYLEDYPDLPTGGAMVRAARVERSLVVWGERLFRDVFGTRGAVFDAFVESEGPRLLTVTTEDLEILSLPWELLRDERGPLTRRGVIIRRQRARARHVEAHDAGELPLRILLAVSRPDDAGFIDPRHTTRAMLDALEPLGGGVVLDFCRPATLVEMERMLVAARDASRPYHIVHFDGHGAFLPEIETGVLCFEEAGWRLGPVNTDLVHAGRFGEMLAAHRIPLVILEACRSGAVGRGGTAPRLVQAGVGSVLAMSHAVHVEATRLLLRRFYEALVAGATTGQAVEAGRAALLDQPERQGSGEQRVALQDWFLPCLYQRGDDSRLVPAGAAWSERAATAARRPPATGQEAGAFPVAPRYAFVGRAWDLRQLERRLLEHRAVLLHGMGGMGKTALARELAFWGSRTGLFPEGACFVSFEQAGGAARALQVLGAHFEGTDFERRSAEDQRRKARELFQARKVLMVWDNFESVLPAFQGGEQQGMPRYADEERAAILEMLRTWTTERDGAGRIVVTCRPQDAGFEGLTAISSQELKGLAKADALALLSEVMRRAGVTRQHEREALEALLAALGNHPLSIELTGPHLAEMEAAEIVRDLQKLVEGLTGEAAAEKHLSLRASLGLSLQRLSTEAREAVRWLGLFRGGVFEDNLLGVSRMAPEAWESVRGELEARALVRVMDAIGPTGRPYLRFHPTLVYAAGDGAADAAVRGRYVEVYTAEWRRVAEALYGSAPHRGMAIMAGEEENYRRAVRWALDARDYDGASAMGRLLANYFGMTGRLRERDRLAMWLAAEVRAGGFGRAAAHREMDEARALLRQGAHEEAVAKLEALVERLRATTEFDAAHVLAQACRNLGSVYDSVGQSQKAIPILRDAVQQWEALAAKAEAAGKSNATARGSLSATLGSLANAFRNSGALGEALATAERGVALDRESKNHRSVAIGLGQIAQILKMQGHVVLADTQYHEALAAAQRSGDRELEGTMLQHQGSLANKRRQLRRAAALYQRALRLFQEMHDELGVMQTCNLLGTVERDAGRLAEARAWYERSREIANRRGDPRAAGTASHNLGILYRLEGVAARKQGDEVHARELFGEAVRCFHENLAIKIDDGPGAANAHSQLGRLYVIVDDLNKAEEHARQASQIHERGGFTEAHFDYDTLAHIARARGPDHEAEAAAWEQKRDNLGAELRRLAGGPSVPKETIQTVRQLASACARAGLNGRKLGPRAAETLTLVAGWEPPLDAVAPFLRDLAGGKIPPMPAGLPHDVVKVLDQVVTAVHQTQAP